MSTPRLLHFPSIHDPSGNLTPYDWTGIPFLPQHSFLLHDVVEGARRGGHAHHVLEEMIVAVSGSFDVLTLNENGPHRWHLNRADTGLYVPPGTWRHLDNFSGNAVAFVLGSHPYDPEDYIRDMDEFLAGLPPIRENVHEKLFEAATKAYYDTLAETGDHEAALDARTRIFGTEKWT